MKVCCLNVFLFGSKNRGICDVSHIVFDSYKKNDFIDFYIFTDKPETFEKYIKSSNVKIIKITKAEFYQSFNENFDVDLKNYKNYQDLGHNICDFKIQWFILFRKHITKSYDYCGFLDHDIILGNLKYIFDNSSNKIKSLYGMALYFYNYHFNKYIQNVGVLEILNKYKNVSTKNNLALHLDEYEFSGLLNKFNMGGIKQIKNIVETVLFYNDDYTAIWIDALYKSYLRQNKPFIFHENINYKIDKINLKITPNT